jgi:hypothetical protein
VEGNVGIGEPSPGAKLDVAGDTLLGGPLTVTGAATLNSELTVMGNVGIGTDSPESKLSVSGGLTVGSGYADTSEAPANGLLVEGNVGIGTTSPDNRLEVNGAVEIQVDNADAKLRFHLPDKAWYSMGIDQSDSRKFKLNYGGDIGESPHFVMTSGGNVGIGTSEPDTKLHVAGDIHANAIMSEAGLTYFMGNVGIGTKNPQKKLDVKGDADIDGQLTVKTLRVNGGTLYGDPGYGATIRLADQGGHLIAFAWNGRALDLYVDAQFIGHLVHS